MFPVFPSSRYNNAALAALNTDPLDTVVKSNYVRDQRQAKQGSFIDQIDAIKGCAGDSVEALIQDILESPLRVRNALIGTLRLREKQRDREIRRQVTAAATGQNQK